MHTRESSRARLIYRTLTDVQITNLWFTDQHRSTRNTHCYLIYPSISCFARTKRIQSFVLPFRASAHNNNDTPVVTYNSTSVYNGYIRAYIYIYTKYIYTSRIRVALLWHYLALWISLRPLLSPVSTQRTCSPCYFGKHLMLIEPLSLFAPRTLPNVTSSPPFPPFNPRSTSHNKPSSCIVRSRTYPSFRAYDLYIHVYKVIEKSVYNVKRDNFIFPRSRWLFIA